MIQVGDEILNEQVDIEDIKFPCSGEDIKKFANRTKTRILALDYKILYNEEDDKHNIEYYSIINEDEKDKQYLQDLNLLVIKNDDYQHLVLITDFNALMYKKGFHTNQFWCRQCLYCFNSKDKLQEHYQVCQQLKENPSLDVYPIKGKNDILKFTNQRYGVQIPFFFVADFESMLVQYTDNKQEINNEATDIEEIIKKTQLIEEHQILSYGLQIHSFDKQDDQYFEYVRQSDDQYEVIEHFFQNIIKYTDQFDERIKKINIEYENNEQVKQQKYKAKECYLCKGKFTEKNYKVVDHDHLTGKVRGIAHRNCNLQFNLYQSKIPIIFHNLRGYDSHFILQHISKLIKQEVQKIDEQYQQTNNQKEKDKLKARKSNIKRINCICQNNEKVQSFEFNKNRFIDSYQFMNKSLRELGEKLTFEQKYYTVNYIKQKYPQLQDQQIQEIINKGQFPYSYLDSLQKLDIIDFPEHIHFFSNLSQSNISLEEYLKAKEIYQLLNMKTFKEYLLFYQAIDVKLLTDVWINFRDLCINYYKLDPGYFISTPSFSFQAMLKFTQIELELITDPEIYQLFEQMLRGGISTVGSINYSQADNKYIYQENNQQNTNQTYIQYVDANNLYGYAMSQKLPIKNFILIESNKISEQFILDYNHQSNQGYIIKCDLIYPKEIHDYTNDFPLAVEKLNVKNIQLSDYQKQKIQQIEQQYNIKINQANIEKLIPNLYDKTDYVCDIRILQLYLQLGLKIKQIKQVVQYEQSDFLKQYIDFNTQKRNEAKIIKDEFKTDFFKLMNNAVYGKTLENIRKRGNYKLVFDKKEAQKIINRRYFKNYIPINEDFVLIQQYNQKTILNKPIFLGMTILDLSKHLMYNYYYNHIKKVYQDVKLIYQDTDSLVLQIKSKEDIYDNMIKNNQYYDFSGLKQSSPLYNKLNQYFIDNNMNKEQQQQFIQNSMQIGRFKDECINDPISEFIAVRSKCYSYLTLSNKNDKKNKGIKSSIVKNELTHEDYKNCIFNNQIKEITQYGIRSYNHQLFTIKQQKLALCNINDKRYQIDQINSLAFGNFRINQQQANKSD